MKLVISKEISLPLDAVTQAMAILAKRRVGKSYTMRRIVEQFFKANQQVVIVDPKGDQWGIRSSADGKKPGFPVLILGGEHGDLPLEVSAGETIANLVVKDRVSVLLDISLFRKHEVATFMTAFLENLYRLKAQEKYRTPLMLVIDEADAIAPQKPQKGEERMLGAANDIVRRGGQRGIGCTLVTQRTAVLNKNVLTQCELLIVLRTIAPQDLAAMKAWIDVHGTPEQGKDLMGSLPSLPIGDAWFWSPGWPTEEGIFKRTHVMPIETFDSGATPKVGQKQVVPKNLADVDLNVLKEQMAATIETAKANDPKLLKDEIRRLTEQLKSAAKSDSHITQTVQPDRSVIEKSVQVALRKNDKEWQQILDLANNAIKKLQRALAEIGTTAEIYKTVPIFSKPMNEEAVPEVPARVTFSAPVSQVKEWVGSEGTNAKPLSKGARTVFSYLSSVYPKEKSKTQIWVAAGYSPGGGFGNLIYELTGVGLIEKTATGYRALHGGENFTPTLDIWDSKLSIGARKIFRFLLGRSDIQTKEQLAEATGYRFGGGFGNLIYELTGKELIVKSGIGYQINPEILDL